MWLQDSFVNQVQFITEPKQLEMEENEVGKG
jgi:hypothetical protein